MEKTCLKCGAVGTSNGDPLDACGNCGAIYSRVEEALAKKVLEQKTEASPSTASSQEMDNAPAPKKNSTVQTVLGAITVFFVAYYFFGGGLEKQAAKNMQDIHDQVASDAVQQYEIARRNGTAIDVCVRAGLVSAAYLQAKNESSYQHWKQIEKDTCTAAGIPH